MLPSRRLRTKPLATTAKLPLRHRIAKQTVRGLVLVVVWSLGVATSVLTGVTTEKVSKATATTPAIRYQVDEQHAFETPAYYFTNDLPLDSLNGRIPAWTGQQDPTVESFEDRYADLLASADGIQAPRWAKVTITNTQDRPITITAAHLVVLKRQPRAYRAFHGAAAGGSSTIRLSFDLAKDRAPGLMEVGAGEELPPDIDAKQGKFSYFAANNKTIESGSSFGFVTYPTNEQISKPSYLEWQLEFQILAKDSRGRNGSLRLVVKAADDRPFHGAVVPRADVIPTFALNPETNVIEPA